MSSISLADTGQFVRLAGSALDNPFYESFRELDVGHFSRLNHISSAHEEAIAKLPVSCSKQRD